MLEPSAKYIGNQEWGIISFEEEEPLLLARDDVESCALPEIVALDKVEEKLAAACPPYKRPHQVKAYVAHVKRNGEQAGGLWTIPRTYRKKGGRGRAYAFYLSLQMLEGVAREDLMTFPEEARRKVFEFDQHNAFPRHLAMHLISLLGEETFGDLFPVFASFAFHARVWRKMLEDYYETDAKRLKRLLLSCMYTRSRLAPVERQDKFPFLDTLHSEMSRIEATLVEKV